MLKLVFLISAILGVQKSWDLCSSIIGLCNSLKIFRSINCVHMVDLNCLNCLVEANLNAFCYNQRLINFYYTLYQSLIMPVNLLLKYGCKLSVCSCLAASYRFSFCVVAKKTLSTCVCFQRDAYFKLFFHVLAVGSEHGWLSLSLVLVAC